jgi:hypothetical protein
MNASGMEKFARKISKVLRKIVRRKKLQPVILKWKVIRKKVK